MSKPVAVPNPSTFKGNILVELNRELQLEVWTCTRAGKKEQFVCFDNGLITHWGFDKFFNFFNWYLALPPQDRHKFYVDVKSDIASQRAAQQH